MLDLTIRESQYPRPSAASSSNSSATKIAPPTLPLVICARLPASVPSAYSWPRRSGRESKERPARPVAHPTASVPDKAAGLSFRRLRASLFMSGCNDRIICASSSATTLACSSVNSLIEKNRKKSVTNPAPTVLTNIATAEVLSSWTACDY